MALQKIHDFDPGYKEVFSGDEIKGKSVYSEGTDEKIGTVNDTLVDENGQFRYLVVDIGSWFSGKKVLLPVGRSRNRFPKSTGLCHGDEQGASRATTQVQRKRGS